MFADGKQLFTDGRRWFADGERTFPVGVSFMQSNAMAFVSFYDGLYNIVQCIMLNAENCRTQYRVGLCFAPREAEHHAV